MTEHHPNEQTPLITPTLVALDAAPGAHRRDVIKFLARKIGDSGRADDANGLAGDALAREATAPTGIPGGIAIPHCRSAHVLTASLGFARLAEPVDFGADDERPADIVFMIAAPDGANDVHLQLLAKLARGLMDDAFTGALRAAKTPEEVARIVTGQVQPELLDASAEQAESPPAGSSAGQAKDAASKAVEETAASKAAPALEASASKAEAASPSAEPEKQGKPTGGQAPRSGKKVIVGVTSCPTGIAHTFMAAEALERAGSERGVTVAVEGQGSGKIEALDPELVKRADAVVFAHSLPIKGIERFAGKPVVDVDVKAAVDDAGALVDQALAAAEDPHAKRVQAGAGAAQEAAEEENVHWARRLQQAVMTGVSYMIPFVAAGGLLIALGYLFGGYDIGGFEHDGAKVEVAKNIVSHSSLWNLPDIAQTVGGKANTMWAPHALFGSPFCAYLGAVFYMIGTAAMGFLVPALAGYISFGLAGRPGIAPGFAMGAVAVAVDSGFIGGLIGGILAGYVASWLTGLSTPRWLRGLMPVVVIPLATTLLVGSVMYMLLGRPLEALMNNLEQGLKSMSEGGGSVFLGIILGLMMCFDLGGPINKSAYLFATAGLAAETAASYEIMAAVMAAGMVPPLALALATAVRPRLFTSGERENGRAAWLLGASFISEGAIPFAAAAPLRIIPATMAGGAVTGALTMLMHVGSRAPHGGVFVAFAIDGFAGFALAILAGMAVTAALVILLKSLNYERGAGDKKRGLGKEKQTAAV